MQRSANYTVDQTSETMIKSTITVPTKFAEFIRSPTVMTPPNTYIYGGIPGFDISADQKTILRWPTRRTTCPFTLTEKDHNALLALLKDLKRQWQEQITEIKPEVATAIISELNYQTCAPGTPPSLENELKVMAGNIASAKEALAKDGSARDAKKWLRLATATGVRAMDTHSVPSRK